MPIPPKSSLHAFGKKAATPPMAASMLAAKRSAAKPPAPATAVAKPAPAPEAAAPEGPDDETMLNISEMLEEAAQEAEAMANPALEDLIAGYSLENEQDPLAKPEWAVDPETWEMAAKTVGLDVPELAARYDEPFAVAAYLYAKLGGQLPEGEEAPGKEDGEADMKVPGTAAKAMSAVMKSKPKVPAQPAS